MNKLQTLQSVVSKTAGRGGLILRKNSPEIMLAVGVVGVVASTVMACKATLKVDAVLKGAKEDIDKIHKGKKIAEEASNKKHEELSKHPDKPTDIEEIRTVRLIKEKYEKYNYPETDYRRDLAVAYLQTGVDFVKLYGPAVVLGVASIGCIVGSHGIMKRRNIALMAAYKAVEQSFTDYRKRVVEEFGEDKDRCLKNGIKQEVVTVIETDENGKKVKVKKTVESTDPNGISQYARFFDESSSQWVKSPEYNLTFLQCQQNYANDLLHARGHVFLNEVYDMLGIPRTKAGAVVGWVRGIGDDFVDFGIFDGERMKARDFVNGYERSILLDFNVAGVIYDMI